MIKLWDAALTDAVPAVVAAQPWVKALSATWLTLQRQIMTSAAQSQIFTAVDTAGETMLDALAVNLKVDWYDNAASVEEKRRAIKAAMEVRRTMGTVGAMRTTITSVWPESTIEEWFDYGGDPGNFRCRVENQSSCDIQDIVESIRRAKRASAFLEELTMTVREAGGLYFGTATAEVTEYETAMDPEQARVLDWFTDEDGVILTDEAGMILY